MKTIVCTLLGLALSLNIYAQNYLPDEFIVQYVEDVTSAEKEAVRDLYAITDYNQIDEITEHWYNLQFPIQATENGETDVLVSIEELLYHIEIQEGENGQNDNSTARSEIQNGDLNYLLQLNDSGILYDDGTFDPLPFCSDAINPRLIGPALSDDGREQEFIPHIIIVDQLVDIPNENVEVIIDYPLNHVAHQGITLDGFGGDHGNQVYSVIKNVLDATNINATYTNIAIFDANGSATYNDLLRGVSLTRINGLENSIINFSANMVINSIDEDLILLEYWEQLLFDNNTLLVSSAGNQGFNSMENVYPTAGNWTYEISVAATQNCMTEALSYSNTDRNHIDIATEGDGVLVYGQDDYEVVSGTSFSSAFVTTAAAQLAARCAFFNPKHLKYRILESAFKKQEFTGLWNQGRLLNMIEALEGFGPADCGDSNENGYLIQQETTNTLFQINSSQSIFR